MVAASPEFQKHNIVTLVIGPGTRGQAEHLVQALNADPAHVLFDETGKTYKTYWLERVFFSMIQQSAALVVDMQGVVRVAIVANNPRSWLDPQRLQPINDILAELNPAP